MVVSPNGKVSCWQEADLYTYLCNLRFRAAEMPAFAAGTGAKGT